MFGALIVFFLSRKVQRVTGDRRRIVWLAQFRQNNVYIVDNGTFESVLSFLPPVELPKWCEIFVVAGKEGLCHEWSIERKKLQVIPCFKT